MSKRYQIELDRNERDFATFLRSRKVSLSKTDLRVLIASQASEVEASLFDLNELKNVLNSKLSQKNLKGISRPSFASSSRFKQSADCT